MGIIKTALINNQVVINFTIILEKDQIVDYKR